MSAKIGSRSGIAALNNACNPPVSEAAESRRDVIHHRLSGTLLDVEEAVGAVTNSNTAVASDLHHVIRNE